MIPIPRFPLASARLRSMRRTEPPGALAGAPDARPGEAETRFAALSSAGCADSAAEAASGGYWSATATGGVALIRQTCLFLNTFTGVGYWDFPRGQYARVDLKPLGVPANAKSVDIEGMLIISMSVDPDLGLVGFIAKAPSAASNLPNITHYTEVFGVPWGGVRTPVATKIPLENGEFDIALFTKWASPFNLIALRDFEPSIGSFPAYCVNLQAVSYTL